MVFFVGYFYSSSRSFKVFVILDSAAVVPSALLALHCIVSIENSTELIISCSKDLYVLFEMVEACCLASLTSYPLESTFE